MLNIGSVGGGKRLVIQWILDTKTISFIEVYYDSKPPIHFEYDTSVMKGQQYVHINNR